MKTTGLILFIAGFFFFVFWLSGGFKQVKMLKEIEKKEVSCDSRCQKFNR